MYGNEGGSDTVLAETTVQAENKTFTLQAMSNQRGKVIKIKEEGGRGRIVMLPVEGAGDFVKAFGEMEKRLRAK